MTTDNKTLADAKPGGCVQLPTSERERFDAWAEPRKLTLTRWSDRPGDVKPLFVSEVAGNYISPATQAAWEAWQHLSAQPSPGGQGDAAKQEKRFEIVRNGDSEEVRIAALADWLDQCDYRCDVMSVAAATLRALAARQPVGGQGVALLREVSAELESLDCGACIGSDAPMEDLHGRIAAHLAARQPVEVSEGGFRAAASRQTASAESNATAEALIAATHQPVVEPVCSGGFVISNGSGEKYMAWGQVGPEWTEDRSAALWLVRRADAEALAAENEDAWSILPVERCALPPSGWACTLASGHEGPCPTIAAPTAQAVCSNCDGTGVIPYASGQTPEQFEQGEYPCPECTPAQAVDLGTEPMFYIQDTQQFVGNCPMWWGPNGRGYVTRLDEAGRYTEQEAIKQNRTRDTDIPWPCAEIDAIARHTVDLQHMRPRAERLAELALIDSQAVGK